MSFARFTDGHTGEEVSLNATVEEEAGDHFVLISDIHGHDDSPELICESLDELDDFIEILLDARKRFERVTA